MPNINTFRNKILDLLRKFHEGGFNIVRVIVMHVLNPINLKKKHSSYWTHPSSSSSTDRRTESTFQYFIHSALQRTYDHEYIDIGPPVKSWGTQILYSVHVITNVSIHSVFYSLSITLLYVYRLVLWGWGLRTDMVYITLSQPCTADLF